MTICHGCMREYMGFVKISAQHPHQRPQNLCEGWWVGQEGPGTGAAKAPSDSTVQPRAPQLGASGLQAVPQKAHPAFTGLGKGQRFCTSARLWTMPMLRGVGELLVGALREVSQHSIYMGIYWRAM